MFPKLDRSVVLGIVLLAALIIGIGITSLLNTRRLQEASRRAVHSRVILDSVGAVRTETRRLQAGQRAYLISGEQDRLKLYEDARSALNAEIAQLKEATRDDPDHREKVESAEQQVATGLAALDGVIQLRKDKGLEAVIALARDRGPRSFIDPLLETLDEIDRIERENLAIREAETQKAYDRALFYSVAATVLGLVALILFVALLARSVRNRERSRAQLAEQRELLNATLTSIGDGVIATDAVGNVTFLNAVAERLTGWPGAEARGKPLEEIFNIINEANRSRVENPALRALKEGVIVGLANHTRLIARDGTERPIDDSAAPIKTRGQISGAVLVFRDIAEKYESAKKFRDSEEQLRRILESITDAFFSLDADWRFDYINQQAERLMDRKAGDLIGNNLWAEFPKLQGTAFEKIYRQTMDQRQGLTIVDFYPDRNRWYEVRTYPAARGITVYFRDVTESKRIDAELSRLRAESERIRRIYETALANNADFIYVFNLQGRFQYVNPPLLALWKKTLPEAQGKNFFELDYPHELAEKLQQQIQQVIATAQPLRDETPYTGPGGGGIYEYIFVPVIDRDGNVEAVAGSTRDVTDRKQAERVREQLLREVETERGRLADVFQHAPAFMCVLRGPTHIFERSNAGYNQLLGNRKLIGLTVREAVPEVEGQGFLEILDDVYRSGVPFVGTDVLIHLGMPGQAPEPRYLDFVYQPLRDGEGNITGILAQGIDLTQRKRAEEERERLLDRLREQDKRKDEFLATLAHELRNPLSPIRNGVQILQTKYAAEPAIEQTLSMMQRQIGHLIHLVDDLMDVSRVSSGKVILRKGRVELKSLVGAAVEATRQTIENEKHELTIRLPDDEIAFDADETRLVQILANLLGNAAKYTPKNGRIELVATRKDSIAIIRISDSGVGIPAEMLPRVFDMFTQVGTSLDRSQGGLGIGLTLVRRLVELHGGWVEAHSEGKGKGSQFCVYLPISNMESKEKPDAPKSTDADSTVLKILIVDDNLDAAESMAMLMELKGHVVKKASEGEAALRILESFRPDLILLDLGLPGMNGYEIAGRIRENKGLNGVKIAALTGWGQEEDRRRTREAGFDYHLVKPADLSSMQKILEAVSRFK